MLLRGVWRAHEVSPTHGADIRGQTTVAAVLIVGRRQVASIHQLDCRAAVKDGAGWRGGPREVPGLCGGRRWGGRRKRTQLRWKLVPCVSLPGIIASSGSPLKEARSLFPLLPHCKCRWPGCGVPTRWCAGAATAILRRRAGLAVAVYYRHEDLAIRHGCHVRALRRPTDVDCYTLPIRCDRVTALLYIFLHIEAETISMLSRATGTSLSRNSWSPIPRVTAIFSLGVAPERAQSP